MTQLMCLKILLVMLEDLVVDDPFGLDDSIGYVKGSLHDSLAYWESILKPPAPILSIISQGYILPFLSVPGSMHFDNQRSALVHSDLCQIQFVIC